MFPKPKGNPVQINQFGQNILEGIIKDPKRTIVATEEGGFKIFSKDGRGAYFKKDGSFVGFVELQYERKIHH